MTPIRVEKEIAGRTLSLETGKWARQAHGAVKVQYGDTVVLVTVLAAPPSRELDFFPLFVDLVKMLEGDVQDKLVHFLTVHVGGKPAPRCL